MNTLMKRNNQNSMRPAYDRFFNDMLNFNFPSLFFDSPMRTAKQMFRSMPTANISESDEAFDIELAAPGYEKDDLKISLDDNGRTLTVKAEMESGNDNGENDCKKDKKEYSHYEHCYSSFERSFTMPENADTEKISASYKRGILHIVLPKKQNEKNEISKKIEIQ